MALHWSSPFVVCVWSVMKSSVKAVLVTVSLAVVLLVVALVFVLINQNQAAAPRRGPLTVHKSSVRTRTSSMTEEKGR